MKTIMYYECSQCGMRFEIEDNCRKHESKCELINFVDVSLKYWDGEWRVEIKHYKAPSKQKGIWKNNLMIYFGWFPSNEYTDEQAVEAVKNFALGEIQKATENLLNLKANNNQGHPAATNNQKQKEQK